MITKITITVLVRARFQYLDFPNSDSFLRLLSSTFTHLGQRQNVSSLYQNLNYQNIHHLEQWMCGWKWEPALTLWVIMHGSHRDDLDFSHLFNVSEVTLNFWQLFLPASHHTHFRHLR